MFRILILALAAAASLAAANVKLYLKEGGFEVVREYKVDGDRVRFYSVERSDWEEVPVEMVDLKKTEAAIQVRDEELQKVSKAVAEEDEARKEAAREVRMIPQDPGVYRIENGQLRIFKNAESTIHTDKGRAIMKILTPLPTVRGRSTVELQGEHSLNPVTDDRPEFFIQLNFEEQFGIIRLTAPKGKGVRIVETIETEPMVNERTEERDSVPIFTKQLPGSGLYKIWPQAPLEKGEYAVVQFTEGKVNLQIWDFRIQ